MELLDKQRAYSAWLHEHREHITEELRTAYAKFCERPYSSLMHASDFGVFAGIPLFALWLCWGYALSSTVQQLIAGMLCIAFGFLLRYFQKHIIDLACRHFFWDTEWNIINNYIDSCRATDMARSSSKEDKARVEAFYDFCKMQIHYASFRYYERNRTRTIRNK